jgi:hypothetical protein
MEEEESLSCYSPEIVAKKSSAETIALLPLIVLMHGTTDYSIPSYARFVHILTTEVYKLKAKICVKPEFHVDTIPDAFLCYSDERESHYCPIHFTLEF